MLELMFCSMLTILPDFLFRLPPEERVLALQRGNRLNGMGAANGLRACL